MRIEELERIKKFLDREPTKIEQAIFQVAWSEHCSYKTSSKFLKKFASLKGNAGTVILDKELFLSFKIESHNHPSQIDPFNGAATGVGGIIRDIISTGAYPVALLNSLHFGNLELPQVKRIFDGVVRGIAKYGNCTGIPDIGGEVNFHESYTTNSLVNVVCVGLGKRKYLKRRLLGQPGNLIVLYGGLTGRDGIGGADFASQNLDAKRREAIQIPDPFMGKLIIEITSELAKMEEVIGIQDLGAGGLATALPEMAYESNLGVEVYLDRVPLREKGMEPAEILISESQERMIISVKSKGIEKIKRVFEKYEVPYGIIGKVIEESRFRVKYKDRVLTDLPIEFIVKGFVKPENEIRQYTIEGKKKVNEVEELFNRLINSPYMFDRKLVYEQFDSTIGTNTVIGPGYDIAILRIKGKSYGIGITLYSHAIFTYRDPYNGVLHIGCKLLESFTASDIQPLAISDGINLGNPEYPQVYYQLYQITEGLKKFSEFFSLPVISGNVSLYNSTGGSHILPTVIMVMVGKMEPIKKPEVRIEPYEKIWLAGRIEQGWEGFSSILPDGVGKVYPCDLKYEKKFLKFIHSIVQEGYKVFSVGKGGAIAKLLKLAIRHKIGLKIDYKNPILFSESSQKVIIIGKKNKPLNRIAEEFEINIQEIGEFKEEGLLLWDRNIDRKMIKRKIDVRDIWDLP